MRYVAAWPRWVESYGRDAAHVHPHDRRRLERDDLALRGVVEAQTHGESLRLFGQFLPKPPTSRTRPVRSLSFSAASVAIGTTRSAGVAQPFQSKSGPNSSSVPSVRTAPGRSAFTAMPCGPHLGCERRREPLERGLRDAVDEVALGHVRRRRVVGGVRRDVDDAAAAPLRHQGHDRPGKQVEAAHVHAHRHRPTAPRRTRANGTPGRCHRVVDQRVDAPEARRPSPRRVARCRPRSPMSQRTASAVPPAASIRRRRDRPRARVLRRTRRAHHRRARAARARRRRPCRSRATRR